MSLSLWAVVPTVATEGPSQLSHADPRLPGQSKLQARGELCPRPSLTVSESWVTTCPAW